MKKININVYSEDKITFSASSINIKEKGKNVGQIFLGVDGIILMDYKEKEVWIDIQEIYKQIYGDEEE